MSYLLTEIALEMLGYKFYDIYGVHEEINNFQSHISADRPTGASSEPNLATVLGLSPNATPRDANRSRSVVSNDTQVKLPESLTKLMDSEYNKVKSQILRNKSLSAGIMESKTGQTSTSSVIEKEHEKLRQEQQQLRSFRKLVEQSLIQLNPVTFENYCESFKASRRKHPSHNE